MNVRELEAMQVIGMLCELVQELSPDPEYVAHYGIPSKLEQARRCMTMLSSSPTFSEGFQ